MAQQKPIFNGGLCFTGSAKKPVYYCGPGNKPFFNSPKEMQTVIADYFSSCEIGDVLPTIPGLAYHLGFLDRGSISDYGAKEEYASTIKRARLFIEHVHLDWACNGKGSVAGIIFALKCSLGYIEPREDMNNGETRIEVTVKHTRLARPSDDALAKPGQRK